MTKINDLVFYHSGGADNSNGKLDTGGGIGERLYSMSFSVNTTKISGLEIIAAFGFENTDLISINYNKANNVISVSNQEMSFNENYTTLQTDETITIESSNGSYIILQLVNALLELNEDKTVEYILTDRKQNLFDNVLPIESTTGLKDYRVIYVYNESISDATNVIIFTEQPTGDNYFEIATDTINQLITDTGDDEIDPLNDVNAYSYTTNLSDGVAVGTIPAGEFIPIILKRTVNENIQDFSFSELVFCVAAD